MTSTASTYDEDTRADYRKKFVDECGMIPDSGRGLTFGVLFAMGALQILAKGVSVSLLAITNPTWLLIYSVVDVSIHIVFKLVRRDYLSPSACRSPSSSES